MVLSPLRRNPYGAPVMRGILRKPQSIHGILVPRRRFTVWAALYFALFVCLPVLIIALAADTLLYQAVDKPFDTCLSVWCWAG